MRNEFTTIRMHHKVGGDMMDKKLAFGIPIIEETAGGGLKKTTVNKWMLYADYQFECEFSERKNNAIAWGVSTRNNNGEYTNFGKSGNAIKAGDGLFKQMEVGNTFYYNKFSLKVIIDALSELSAGKLDMNDRMFVINTGEYGARQLHEAIYATTSGWTPILMDNSSIGAIQKTSSPLHQNALSAGFQFTEFKAANGVRIKVNVDSMYDDPVKNKVLHPKGGTAMSYRYDIMYIGTMDQPNIQKCVVKNHPDIRGYYWGLRDPFTGRINNMSMSTDEDSAEVHKMSTFGVVVLDPTRTMSIIPSILQG